MAPTEPLLTRYFVYSTLDGGQTLILEGEQLARGSEEALRKFFAEPLVDRAGDYAAISENARRIRRVQATVKTSISDASDEPVAADPEQAELVT